jgi:hypothetical protein
MDFVPLDIYTGTSNIAMLEREVGTQYEFHTMIAAANGTTATSTLNTNDYLGLLTLLGFSILFVLLLDLIRKILFSKL